MSSNNHSDPCDNKNIKPNENENKNYESMTMQEILEGVDPNDSETLMKIREGMINRFLERERVLLEEQLLNDRLKTNLAKKEAEIADYMARQAENKTNAPEDNKNNVDVPKNNKNKKDAPEDNKNKVDVPKNDKNKDATKDEKNKKDAPEDNKNNVDVPKNDKNKDATKDEKNKKDAPRTIKTRQMCQQTTKTKEMPKAQKVGQDHQNLKKPK